MAIAEGPSAGPLTATGTDPRNVDGQAICITVFSTVKWWGRLWLPLVFLYARLVPSAHGTLARLSFIHFARWTLVDSGCPSSACATRTCSSRATSTAAGRSTSTPSPTSSRAA